MSPVLSRRRISLKLKIFGGAMSFEAKDQKRYLICDDVTSKDVIERLFEFGKKDAECRIQGTVANKTNEAIYLNITAVSPSN